MSAKTNGTPGAKGLTLSPQATSPQAARPFGDSTRRAAAFTLIELLVVITIIVVLLALLAPALDKAVYQAQLAVDAANMDATTAAVIVYAFDFKRWYPARGPIDQRGVLGLASHPIKIKDPLLNLDERPVLKGYIQINKMYMDPLGPGKVDLENSHDDTHCYSTYALWYSWSYGTTGAEGDKTVEKRMNRLGDRFTFTEGPPGNKVQYSFNTIMSDFDRIDGGQNFSGHIDRKEVVAQPNVRQDEAAAGVGSVGAIKQTLAFWIGIPGVPQRGLTDLNFSFDDGSLRRYTDVEWDAWSTDGSLARVPEYPEGANYPGTYLHLPKQ